MIYLKLTDGLGNQMFQYACAKRISEQNKEKIILDISSYKDDRLRKFSLDIFNIKNTITVNGFIYQMIYKIVVKLKLRRFLGYKIFIEKKNMVLEEDLISVNKSDRKIYMKGYFQNFQYFKNIEKIIKEEFTLILPLSSKVVNTINDINLSNSVCIHVRRGDYVTDKNANKNNGVCSIKYYLSAIEIMKKNKKNLKFFIFSDDIEWVKVNLHLKNALYVDEDITSKDYEVLELMKNCKNFIISNSTFSWWAAWLSKANDKIVIAPQKWYADNDKNEDSVNLVPSEWIRI